MDAPLPSPGALPPPPEQFEGGALTTTSGGAIYMCAPLSFTGATASQLFDTVPSGGAICAWKGDPIGVVISLDAPDLNQAFTEIEGTYAALHDPH